VIKNPKAILALLTALNLLNYLDRYVLSAVLKPLQDELQLSNFVGGSLATVFLLGFFVTSPLFGHWADRSGVRGRRALIVLGVLVWSLATIATGFATGPWTLIAARAVVGVGEASYVTIAPTIIDEVAPPGRKGSWLAIFYTAIPVGGALGYLTGGAVENATHSWRQAFYVAGIPGLALGFLCLLIRPSVAQAAASVHRMGVLQNARRLLRIPLYRRVVLGQCAYTFAIGGFAYWAPKYLATRYGMETGHAAFVFGLVTVAGGAIGTLVGGRLGDRATRGRTDDDAGARVEAHQGGHGHLRPAVEHEGRDVDPERNQAERAQEAVEPQGGRGRLPRAGGEADAPGDHQRVAGERDERARPGDVPQDHRRTTCSQHGVVRTAPSTETIAASDIESIRSGRSESTLASTSAATGSSLITVAWVAGPGAPVSGSIR